MVRVRVFGCALTLAVVWKGPTARLSPTLPALPAALGSSAAGHEAACAIALSASAASHTRGGAQCAARRLLCSSSMRIWGDAGEM